MLLCAVRIGALPWRPVLGEFLPAELVRELADAGVVERVPRPLTLEPPLPGVLRIGETGRRFCSTPLLLLRV